MKTYSHKLSFLAVAGLVLLGWMAGAGAAPPAAAKAKAGAVGDDLSAATRRELAQVRAATAKYHDISKALEDGYVDIDVFIPGMGFHYLKPSLLDGTFEVDKPELLVYAPQNNRLRLVAVEYAVPLDLAPTPPEGFNGDADHWHRNEEFNLWTLHAWVWLHNPHGMFAEFNPRVQ